MFLQHGRFLRTACVTYPYSKEPYRVHSRRLAPNHCLSPPESDSERASPKRNNKSLCKIPQKRTRKQLKSPTKTIKDVNDNTKKECLTINTTANSVKPKPHTKNINKCRKDDFIKKKDKCITKKEDKIKVKEEKKEIKSWTRDEDKTMLEILKGESVTEQVFCRISELLPHRSMTEIKERFCHVMNLLQQMAVGEVT